MLIGRSSLVQSNVLQWSPTKLTVDLQEARRQHRSRNRSTEYLRTLHLTQGFRDSRKNRYPGISDSWSLPGVSFSIRGKRIFWSSRKGPCPGPWRNSGGLRGSRSRVRKRPRAYSWSPKCRLTAQWLLRRCPIGRRYFYLRIKLIKSTMQNPPYNKVEKRVLSQRNVWGRVGQTHQLKLMKNPFSTSIKYSQHKSKRL